MDGETICVISFILLVLVYIPGLIPLFYYIHSKFQSGLRRDETKESICLALFVFTFILCIINIALLSIYG